MNRFLKIAGRVGLGLALVAALFVIGAVVPVPGSGESLYDIRVVTSGSMEPAIKTGSVVAYAPQRDYSEGDVVVFKGSGANPMPVTHRIVETETGGGETLYVTKGDANEDVDFRRVREVEVLGEVFLAVPYAGYLAVFLRTELGFTLLVAIPLILLILSTVRDAMAKGKTRKDA